MLIGVVVVVVVNATLLLLLPLLLLIYLIYPILCCLTAFRFYVRQPDANCLLCRWMLFI